MGEGGRGPSPGSFPNKLFTLTILTLKNLFVNIPNIKSIKLFRPKAK